MFKKIFASFLLVAALLIVGGQTNQAEILITDDYDDGEFVSARYNGVYGYVLEKYLEDAEK